MCKSRLEISGGGGGHQSHVLFVGAASNDSRYHPLNTCCTAAAPFFSFQISDLGHTCARVYTFIVLHSCTVHYMFMYAYSTYLRYECMYIECDRGTCALAATWEV